MHIWVIEVEEVDGCWSYWERKPSRSTARSAIKRWRRVFNDKKWRIRKYVREEV